LMTISMVVEGRKSNRNEEDAATTETLNTGISAQPLNISQSVRNFFQGLQTRLKEQDRHDPMTKNQISIPLGNGTLAGLVGSVLVPVLFGLSAWMGFISYLGKTPLKKDDPDRKSGIMSILADTVENSMNKPPNYRFQEYKIDADHEDCRGQGLQELNQAPSPSLHYRFPEKPEQTDDTKSNLRVQNSWIQDSGLRVSSSVPVTDVRHSRITASVPVTDVRHSRITAIRVPESMHGGRVHNIQHTQRFSGPKTGINRTGSPDDKNSQKKSPQEIDYNTFHMGPFSLPGSFVNPERKGHQKDDISYYFEIPGKTFNPLAIPKKEVTYFYETPPKHRPTVQSRPQKPVISSNDDVKYYFEVPPGVTIIPKNGARRNLVVTHERRNNERRPGFTQRPDKKGKSPTAFKGTKDIPPYVYEYPPLGLLNPKPNKWKAHPGSRPSTVPFDNNGMKKISEGDHSAVSKHIDSRYNTNSNNIKYNSASRVTGTSTNFFPATITPRPDKSSTAGTGDLAVHSLPTDSRDELDYDEIITAFKLQNGVPINWMPKDARPKSDEVS
ncbi:hypothetical protein SK128_005742, partial [Halocaridina rubra]